jgi:hypothetical protein
MQEILGVARHVLTTAGGGLVANGYVTNDEMSAIVGGVLALAGVAWSIYQKHQARA